LQDIIQEFVTKTNEPWITQDSLSTAGDMLIFAMALEKAGAADRRKVAQAIREMDTSEGPARFFPGGRVKFDENGRRVGADVVVVQWQNGVPLTVYPTEAALAKPIWPRQ
jgi:branched-chain amino acid transport system substrate-binding protein